MNLASVHLRSVACVENESLRARALSRVKKFKHSPAARMRPKPRLQRHREISILDHRLEKPVYPLRILRKLRARAFARHLRHRTAGVEVDLHEARRAIVRTARRRLARGERKIGLACAEELARDRPLARHRLHQMARRRRAVREPRCGNHLGVREICAALGAQPAERRVGEPCKRSEDELHFASMRGTSAGS